MNGRHDGSRLALSEGELVHLLARWLKRDGYRVRIEVSNMGQSADLVATKGRWVTVIEAKLSNWKRAVSQCHGHDQVADYICVAIATVRVPSELISDCDRTGYGVIHFEPRALRFQWIVRPRRNLTVWKPQRHRWARVMRGVALCK